MALLERFFPPKWKHPDPLVRRQAVFSLTDDAVLQAIARTDSDEFVRMTAVRAISSQSALADIANTAPHAWVRTEATQKISDPQLLASLARSATDVQVCLAAVQKLTDQSTLLALAASTDPAIQVAAERRLIAELVKAPQGIEAFDLLYRKVQVARDPEVQAALAAVAATHGDKLSEAQLASAFDFFFSRSLAETDWGAFGLLSKLVAACIGTLSAPLLHRLAGQSDVGQRRKAYFSDAHAPDEATLGPDDTWGKDGPGYWIESGTVLNFSRLREQARTELRRRDAVRHGR